MQKIWNKTVKRSRRVSIENKGREENLWNEEVNDERLRTFIKRLRIKTSKDIIENISGQGYLISILDS